MGGSSPSWSNSRQQAARVAATSRLPTDGYRVRPAQSCRSQGANALGQLQDVVATVVFAERDCVIAPREPFQTGFAALRIQPDSFRINFLQTTGTCDRVC